VIPLQNGVERGADRPSPRQVNQAVLAVDETGSGFATYMQPRTILELVGFAGH
jgi:hypothetical protein